MTSKQFESLTKAEKRVAIAKDVIAQLKYYARTGSWAYFHMKRTIGWDTQLQKELIHKRNILECRVCALGGVMLSSIKYCNKATYGDVWEVGRELLDFPQLKI